MEMDDELLIGSSAAGDDLVAENAIRPRQLTDYIGQAVVREQM